MPGSNEFYLTAIKKEKGDRTYTGTAPSHYLQINAELICLLTIKTPFYSVSEQPFEPLVFEKTWAMTKLKIHILSLNGFVGPDYGVVAHLHVGGGGVAIFIYRGKHSHIAARRTIVGVPFIIGENEFAASALHHGMLGVFHHHSAIGEPGYIVFKCYAAHKVAEPVPQRIAVELTEKRGVMEPNPCSATLFDIAYESCFGIFRPCVWREIELYHKVVVGEKTLAYSIGSAYFVNGEVFLFALLYEPLHGSPGECAVLTSAFA